MNETTQGFTPTHAEESIKPPLISFSLILIGMVLGVAGGVLLYAQDFVQLGNLPIAMVIICGVLVAGGSGYLIARKTGIESSKRSDEKRFASWAKANYGIELDAEQLDQLYNYSSTIIDTPQGSIRYVLHYDLSEGAYYVYTEEQIKEQVETGLIAIINADLDGSNEDTSPVTVFDGSVKIEGNKPVITLEGKIDSEEAASVESSTIESVSNGTTATTEKVIVDYTVLSLPELKALARERGVRGYSKMNKPTLVALLAE